MTDPLTLAAASAVGVALKSAFDYLKARTASNATVEAKEIDDDATMRAQLLKRVELLERKLDDRETIARNLLLENSHLRVELAARDASIALRDTAIATRDAAIATLSGQVTELTTDCNRLKSEVAKLVALVPA